MKEKKKIPWGLIYVGLTVVVMIVFGLVVAVGFIADMFLRFAFFGGGRNNNNGGNPVVLILGLAAMIVAPLVATAPSTK